MTTARSTMQLNENSKKQGSETTSLSRLVWRCAQVATVFLAVSLWGAAQAQEQRVIGGSVIAYYFDGTGKLIAGEAVLDTRLIKPSSQSGMDLLMSNACNNMPPPPATATMQVGGVSATAVYVQTAGSPSSSALAILGVEDMTGVTDRQIRPIRPTGGGGGPICKCALVWCGPVKCCPPQCL
jgi:hypothetical protein